MMRQDFCTVRTPVTHSPFFICLSEYFGNIGCKHTPVIAGAIAVNNTKAQTATDIGIRLAVMLSMPCAVIMYLMSKMKYLLHYFITVHRPISAYGATVIVLL